MIPTMNQFAPSASQGANIPPPEIVGYEERPYEYVYNPPNGVLTAAQFLNPDNLAIQTDADFYLRGWYISLFTAAFQIQLLDATGYQLSSGLVNSQAISQDASDPTVISPEHPFAAGGKIQIVIQDLGGGGALQIVFKGVKRFKVIRSADPTAIIR